MSLFDFFTGGPTDPDMDRKVSSLLGGITRYQVGQSVADTLFQSEDEKLARTNTKLDIAMKRRTLGLQDSDDYEDAVNDDRTLYAIGARGALQAIPEAGYLSPKIAESFSIKPRLSSLLGDLGHVGSTRGGRIGSTILRFFGRR